MSNTNTRTAHTALSLISDRLAETHCALTAVLTLLTQSDQPEATALCCLMQPHINAIDDLVNELEALELGHIHQSEKSGGAA